MARVTAYAPLRTGARPAHDLVTIQAADRIFQADGVDWAVCGDSARDAYGHVGLRDATYKGRDIFRAIIATGRF
jgi:hypothetical protein